MSYHLPRPAALEALGLDENYEKRITMQEIAKDLGIDLSQLTTKVRTYANSYRDLEK